MYFIEPFYDMLRSYSPIPLPIMYPATNYVSHYQLCIHLFGFTNPATNAFRIRNMYEIILERILSNRMNAT